MSELSYGEVVDFTALENLIDVDRFAKSLAPEVQKAMEHAKGQIQRLLPDGATGNLRRSLIASVTITEAGVEGRVQIPTPNAAFGYARYVEYGRPPGKMPPYGPGSSLYKWASRKYTSAQFKSTGKVSRKTPEREKAIAGMSFLIARKIGRTGTKAQHPFALGWKAAYPQVSRIIANATHNALQSI